MKLFEVILLLFYGLSINHYSLSTTNTSTVCSIKHQVQNTYPNENNQSSSVEDNFYSTSGEKNGNNYLVYKTKEVISI